MGQLTTGGGGGVYLPDYTVRQLTDLQIIKVAKINACTHNKKHQPLLLLTRLNVNLLHIECEKIGNTSKNSLHLIFKISEKCRLFLCCSVCLWYVLIPDSDWTQASCLSSQHTLIPLMTELHLTQEYFSLKYWMWSLTSPFLHFLHFSPPSLQSTCTNTNADVNTYTDHQEPLPECPNGHQDGQLPSDTGRSGSWR